MVEVTARNLGRKLSEAGADKKRILLNVGIRAVLGIIFMLAGISSIKDNPIFALVMLLIIIFIVVYPYLSHRKDYVIFYENGVDCKGEVWPLSSLEPISWRTISMQVGSRQKMDTKIKEFDVTFIDGAKSAYNRAYLNQ